MPMHLVLHACRPQLLSEQGPADGQVDHSNDYHGGHREGEGDGLLKEREGEEWGQGGGDRGESMHPSLHNGAGQVAKRNKGFRST
eukprot:363609-Chlamydomonas_euryale.AAC.4